MLRYIFYASIIIIQHLQNAHEKFWKLKNNKLIEKKILKFNFDVSQMIRKETYFEIERKMNEVMASIRVKLWDCMIVYRFITIALQIHIPVVAIFWKAGKSGTEKMRGSTSAIEYKLYACINDLFYSNKMGVHHKYVTHANNAFDYSDNPLKTGYHRRIIVAVVLVFYIPF